MFSPISRAPSATAIFSENVKVTTGHNALLVALPKAERKAASFVLFTVSESDTCSYKEVFSIKVSISGFPFEF